MRGGDYGELVPVRLLPFHLLSFRLYFRPKSGVSPTSKIIIFGHQSDVKIHLDVFEMCLGHVKVISCAIYNWLCLYQEP